MKVVVIDDSDIALEFTSAALVDAGIQVVTLTSPLGSTAAIIGEKPEVVLLDIDMPALSGEKVASILKRQRLMGATKIILYSDRDEKELLAAQQRCGADGFIRKTRDSAHLVAEVRRLAAG